MIDPLAFGFDLRSGHQNVTVPQWVAPGDDYQIVRTSIFFPLTLLLGSLGRTVFGDSGNFGEPFRIIADSNMYYMD